MRYLNNIKFQANKAIKLVLNRINAVKGINGIGVSDSLETSLV